MEYNSAVFHQRTSAQIYVYGEMKDSFEIRTSVYTEGCVLSSTIFNYAMDNGLLSFKRYKPVQIIVPQTLNT